MTFHAPQDFSGILQPHELAMIQRVYSKIVSNEWFTSDYNRREEFASFIVHMYLKGMGEETRLYEFSLAAALDKFHDGIKLQTVHSG